MKLIVDEPESVALHRWYVEAERLATSRVGVVETRRASARCDCDPVHRERILSDVEIIELDRRIAGRAADLEPALVRTLDAVHIATAMALVPELDAFVTYDDRTAGAARALGLPVVRPA